MKRISAFVVIALLAFLAGCDADSPTAVTGNSMEVGQGSIQGSVVLDPDIPGTVAGTIVQLFCDPQAAYCNQAGMTYVVGDNGEFAFNGVCCGTHYIGLWKDNDANGIISSGDFSFDRVNPEPCCVRKNAVDYHTLIVTVVP